MRRVRQADVRATGPSGGGGRFGSSVLSSKVMRAAELPSPDDRHAVAAFAMSFDGYKHFGSFAACAEEAALKRRATLADLRNELFLAYRASNHRQNAQFVETSRELLPLFQAHLEE